MLLTDSNCESEQPKTSNGVLEQVWTTSAQEGGTSAVILAVVGGVEADKKTMLARKVLGILSKGSTYIPVAMLRGFACREVRGKKVEGQAELAEKSWRGPDNVMPV